MSTVVGSAIDWFVAFSRSASYQPAPCFDFRWRTITPFVLLDERGKACRKKAAEVFGGVELVPDKVAMVECCCKWDGNGYGTFESG